MAEPTTPDRQSGGRLRRGFLAVAATISLIASIAAGTAFGGYLWAAKELSRNDIESQPDPDTGEKVIGGPCEKRGCNFLVLGSDSRIGLSPEEREHFGSDKDIGGQRSDTIILVHVPPGAGKAVVLHFPRDLWVDIPGLGMGKINTAFEGGIRGGGPDLVARTVERTTGLHLNHFLYVNLAGFEGVVDALGGVPICVQRPMHDDKTGLDLPRAGCYRLMGEQALAFVRTRNQPCDLVPDFARITRQQQFLRAVLAKVLSPSQITHIPELVPAVGRNIVKDSELTPADLLNLAHSLQGVASGDVDFRVVPSVPKDIVYDGIFTSTVQMTPDAKELFRRIRDNQPLGQLGLEQSQTLPSPAIIHTGVFDAASLGKAADVLDVLVKGGFDALPDLEDAAAIRGAVKGSAILFAPGADDMAKVVHSYIPNLEVREARKGLPGGLDVAVVVTARYEPEPPGGGGQGTQPEC